MWPCLPPPRYLVSAANRLHAVVPFFFGLLASRQSKLQPPQLGSTGRPRCLAYHTPSFLGFLALKNTPPIPVTRFVDFVFMMRLVGCLEKHRLAQRRLGVQQAHRRGQLRGTAAEVRLEHRMLRREFAAPVEIL